MHVNYPKCNYLNRPLLLVITQIQWRNQEEVGGCDLQIFLKIKFQIEDIQYNIMLVNSFLIFKIMNSV